MPPPLDDLRVIDLSSGPAGGMATMVLADFGADVIKVERPEGDPFRSLPAAPMWLRGKRSVVLDLREPDGQARLHDLVRTADVVVASYAPGKAAALGADHATLSALNPGLVYCSITGFGPVGPYAGYPGYEHVVAAKAGRMMTFQGMADREGPGFSVLRVATHATSMATVAGAIGALLARERTGRGQLVETSLLQGLLNYDMNGLVRGQLARRDPETFATDPLAMLPRMPTLNYHPVQTKDGRWIQLGNLLQHLFEAFLVAADLTEVYYGDPRFNGGQWESPEAMEAFRDLMLERMRERDAEEWMRTFVENGSVAATIFNTTEGALDDIDIAPNGNVVEFEDEHIGRTRQLGPVADLTVTPAVIERGHPAVGQHTEQVLAELAAGTREAWQPTAGGAANGASPTGGALEGVTVLEFSTIIATPLGASLIGDLGARVIKVEPIGGDPYRGMGIGIGAAKTNVSKESIALNLKSDEAQKVLRGLIERADVIVHNYRPGVPERLGMGYEQARAINPRIIHISANGYGPHGPGAHRPSTHPIPGAGMGGAGWQAGEGMPPGYCDSIEQVREASRLLMRSNEVNPDPNTSAVIAAAALLGLYARERHGVGQQIFVNMLGANTYANSDDFLTYEGKRARPTIDSGLHGHGALYRLYRCAEGWVFLGVVTEREWAALVAQLASPELADGRFASAEGRSEHDAALASLLEGLFAAKAASQWEAELTPLGVGCVRADGPMPGEFWLDDAHVRENDFIVERHHARYGDYFRHGPLQVLHDTPGSYGPAVLAGEHTDAILGELGYDADAIATLRANGDAWSEQVEVEYSGFF